MSSSQLTLDLLEACMNPEMNEKPEKSSFYDVRSFETYLQHCCEYSNEQDMPSSNQRNLGVFSQDQLCIINELDNRNQIPSDCGIEQKPKGKKFKTRKERREFSEIDDEKILKLILQYGPKFQKISKKFPGKTSSMLKNRYYKYLRYRWGEILGDKYSNMNIPLPVDDLKDSLNTLNLCQEAKSIMLNLLNLLA